MAVPVAQIRQQVGIIQQVMKEVMKPGEHYGTIPGCGDKRSLLKPGAEKIMMVFRLSNDTDVQVIDMGNEHKEFRVKVTLSAPSGQKLGAGVGSCSTLESKYRYRKAGHKCPECGAEETIIRGKKEYGGGWICFGRKGGCGSKFEDGDPRIENQNIGRVEHDNPADYYNTCLKMAGKATFYTKASVTEEKRWR